MRQTCFPELGLKQVRPYVVQVVKVDMLTRPLLEPVGRSIHALVRVDAASKLDWDKKVTVMKPGLNMRSGFGCRNATHRPSKR